MVNRSTCWRRYKRVVKRAMHIRKCYLPTPGRQLRGSTAVMVHDRRITPRRQRNGVAGTKVGAEGSERPRGQQRFAPRRCVCAGVCVAVRMVYFRGARACLCFCTHGVPARSAAGNPYGQQRKAGDVSVCAHAKEARALSRAQQHARSVVPSLLMAGVDVRQPGAALSASIEVARPYPQHVRRWS